MYAETPRGAREGAESTTFYKKFMQLITLFVSPLVLSPRLCVHSLNRGKALDVSQL